MNPQTIINKDPAELRPHSLVKDLPRWAKDDPRFYGLCDDIRDNGIQTPLKITQEGRVLDGELCRLAARALQMASVPCVIVPDDQAAETVLRGLVRRRHLTKGQLAFLAVPLLEPAYEEGRKRRAENLRQGTKVPKPNSVGVRESTLTEYASLMGFSGELLRQANWLHAMFAKYGKPEKWGDSPEPILLKDYVTAMIFREENPASIGEANRAVGSFIEILSDPKKKTGGAPKEIEAQIMLFVRLTKDEVARWDYWQKFTPHQQRDAIERITRKIITLPVQKCEALADYHKHMARLYEKAARDNKKLSDEVAA